MQVTLTINRSGSDSVDVRITANRPLEVPELMALLGEAPAEPLFSGSTLLPAQARLGDPGLRHGCTLFVGSAAERRPDTHSVLWLKVSSGPDCGRVIPLHRGRHVVGRAAEADIVLNDPQLSRRHACLWVGAHSVEVQDLGSSNGTLINGEPVGDKRRMPLPGSITVGTSQLEMTADTDPPAGVTPDVAGTLMVRRPPRSIEVVPPGMLAIPEAPPAAPRPRTKWLAVLIPVLISAVLAAAMRSTQLLAFMAFSPVTVLASTISDRRSWRRNRSTQLAGYHAARSVSETALDRSLQDELATARLRYVDAAGILRSATSCDCRLWERRPGTDTFLALRLGLADQPSRTTISHAGKVIPAGTVPMAPVVVSLAERALGVAGPERWTVGLRRWLIGQLAVLHSPAELSMVLLTDPSHDLTWRWLRWLAPDTLTVAITSGDRRAVAEQLSQLLRTRQRQRAGPDRPWSGRWTLVVIDPASLIVELPCLNELIDQGAPVGLAVLCFARQEQSLPARCPAILRLVDDAGTEAILTNRGNPPLPVRIERVGPGWAEQVARALAPLRDAEEIRPAVTSDRSALLGEALGLAEVSAEAVRRSWRTRSPRPAAPIGVSGDRTFEIDLAADGPHLLVAGTTGSGKSELLRVLITSLALRYPPTELTFVLVDYKGGAAFAECAELPHVTGVVTDLDPHLTRRALVALDAELRRREEAFAQAGTSEFADYERSGYGLGTPLARLVLVVDEFATLAERMPELLTGLLSIAQRGRSLGVHLVLATQRPAGVLSADIKANIGLRIALRMADANESVDVVGVDTASRISRGTPGFAIARHADGQLVEFQTACISQPAASAEVVTITELDAWNRSLASAPDPDLPSHLTVLKQAVLAAATGMPRPTPPWLDPLPEVLCVEPSPDSSLVVFGRSDEPAESRQAPVGLDLAAGGSLGLVGGPRSGRTTAIRTIIGVAVGQLAPDRLHLYVIDCAGAALRPLRQLPHCGAMLDTTEPAAVPRLITRLAGEHRRRQQMLAEYGAADFAEGLAIGFRLPAVLVALDGWDRLCNLSDEVDGGRSADLLGQLVREGAATGFSFVIAGDRSILGARIGSALSRKLLLPLADRNDYATAGVDMAAVPRVITPGRAVTAEDGIEVQIGILAEDPASAAQWECLRARALTTTTGSSPERPTMAESPVSAGTGSPAEPARFSGPTIRMRPLPAVVDANWLLEQRDTNGHCLLGVGRDDASVIECPLLEPHSRFLIAGPDASGRSTAAILIARQARSSGLRVFVAAPARSRLAAWADENHISACRPEEPLDKFAAELLVIDDAEQFTDTAAGNTLQAWIARTAASVVATARTPDVLTSFRGIGTDLRRYRSGLLLQPCAADGEIFGVRLPQLPSSGIAGRGVLVTRETRDCVAGYEPIQVAA